MRILGHEQIGCSELGHHERAARIDLVHEIEALHICCLAIGQRDRARIVDDDVDAAEMLRGFIQSAAHGRLVAHIDSDRQRIAARLLDVFGGGVDRAGQLGIDLCGLGSDRDIRAVARCAQADRQTNAARRAGNEQRFSLECRRRHATPPAIRIRIDDRRMPDLPSRVSWRRERRKQCGFIELLKLIVWANLLPFRIFIGRSGFALSTVYLLRRKEIEQEGDPVGDRRRAVDRRCCLRARRFRHGAG